MALIEKLDRKIETKNFLIVQQSIQQESCPGCSGSNFWKAWRSDQWRCVKCDPPANVALVESRRGETIDVGASASKDCSRVVVVSYDGPACIACNCHWIVESVRHLEVEYFCWSCKKQTCPVEIGRTRILANEKSADKKARSRWG